MRRFLAIFALFGAVTSALWLAGYSLAIWPFAVDGIRARDFSFLSYPHVKWYTELDQRTGQMSDMRIDWFSVADGPTGIVYAHRYFPCWIISLVAVAALVVCVFGARSLLESDRNRV